MSPPPAGTSGRLRRKTLRNGDLAIGRLGRAALRHHQTTAGRAKPRGMSRLIAIICGRRTKWIGRGVLAPGRRGHRLAGGQAAGRGEERRVGVPARVGRVDPGTERAGHLPVQELQPRPGGLRTRQRGDLGRPGQGATRTRGTFASLSVVGGRVAPPIESSDHKAIETIVGSDLGYNSDIERLHLHAAEQPRPRTRTG